MKTDFKKFLMLGVASFSVCWFSAMAQTGTDAGGTSYVDTLTEADADAIAANEAATAAMQSDSAEPLDRIAKNTYAALKAFNSFILSWLHPDDSKSTTEIAPNFFNYFKYKFENDTMQRSMQPDLIKDLSPLPTPDLNYSTLLGNAQADTPEKQAAALNYIKNLAALNFSHNKPFDLNNLSDTQNAKPAELHLGLVNTTTAIQTYNAYLLSKYYVEYKNGAKLTKAQYDLQNKASDEAWLLSVATETSVGILLRQLLLFTSQLYLVTLESLDIQNKQLAATAMTNSLLMINNQEWEVKLHDYAAGRQWLYR